MLRRSVILVAPVIIALSSLSAPALLAPAGASTPLAAPRGLHFEKAGDRWMTVAVSPVAHATGYRVYASTVRENVYGANLGRAYRSRVWSRPTATIYGLPRTLRPYYFRIQAISANHHRLSDHIGTGGLRPGRPWAVTASSASGATVLSWRNGGGTRFVVARATNAAMTAGRYDYTVSAGAQRFTPYGLAGGQRYYYRVQARNYGATSYWSTPMSAVNPRSEQSVRVLTYNVLKQTSDGQRTDGAATVISPWTLRRYKAAELVRSAKPDVVGIEEAGYYVGSPYSGVRQVDDLTRLLPGYRVAHTETPQPPYYNHVYQDYVVYNTATVNAVAGSPNGCSCGVWELGHGHRAAFAILQKKGGGKFLFVAPHLANPLFSDSYRRSEAENVLADVARLNTGHLPVVYGGDFNSDMRKGSADVAGNVMKQTLTEASDVAQTKYNPTYDSYNQYRRTPPRYSLYIDRIFVSPGVGVRSWGIIVALNRGQFVGVIPSDHNPVFALVTMPVLR